MLQPWERQPTDTPASFEAFAIFRDLGPTRSIGKVQEQCKKNISLLYRWSSQHNWSDRVAAYDNHLDQLRLKEEEEARRLMNQEHAALAQLMLKKVRARLEKLDPEELSTHDTQKWLDTGTKVERQARGEAPDQNENGGGNVIVNFIDDLDSLPD